MCETAVLAWETATPGDIEGADKDIVVRWNKGMCTIHCHHGIPFVEYERTKERTAFCQLV